MPELRLRPHHIFCLRFSSWSLPERGDAFNIQEQQIRQTLKSDVETIIEVVEGIDGLCSVCPLCRDGRCQSAEGDETEVRKWDAIILKEIGMCYGDRLSAGEFSKLILGKAPLRFCETRCRLRGTCDVLSRSHPA
jgi:hypothetical protein